MKIYIAIDTNLFTDASSHRIFVVNLFVNFVVKNSRNITNSCINVNSRNITNSCM